MVEIIQWGVIALLSLLVLGVLQRVQLLARGPAQSLNALNGPEIGHVLPTHTRSAIRSTQNGSRPHRGGLYLIAFVSDSCSGCGRILSELERGIRSDDATIVLVALRPTPMYESALQELGAMVIPDATGELWKECQIQATPTLVLTDGRLRVIRKEITHDLTAFLRIPKDRQPV